MVLMAALMTLAACTNLRYWWLTQSKAHHRWEKKLIASETTSKDLLYSMEVLSFTGHLLPTNLGNKHLQCNMFHSLSWTSFNGSLGFAGCMTMKPGGRPQKDSTTLFLHRHIASGPAFATHEENMIRAKDMLFGTHRSSACSVQACGRRGERELREEHFGCEKRKVKTKFQDYVTLVVESTLH